MSVRLIIFTGSFAISSKKSVAIYLGFHHQFTHNSKQPGKANGCADCNKKHTQTVLISLLQTKMFNGHIKFHVFIVRIWAKLIAPSVLISMINQPFNSIYTQYLHHVKEALKLTEPRFRNFTIIKEALKTKQSYKFKARDKKTKLSKLNTCRANKRSGYFN